MAAVSVWDSFDSAEMLDCIDITSETSDLQKKRYKKVHKKYHKEASRIAEMLLKTDRICEVGNSGGKDSYVVTLIALEAYRLAKQRAKAQGKVFIKPLIINTIDTLMEELPVQFYCDYSIPQIQKYAKESGIHLIYNRISPTKLNSFVMRYLGARKFFTNATRTADCTDYFKLTPLKAQQKETRQLFPHFKQCNLSGVRITESARRSHNMAKQSTDTRTIKQVEQSDDENISYAPIRDWDADDVFALLRLTGDDPLVTVPSLEPIRSFQRNAGLLIEIYGDASAPDTCQINLSDDGEEIGGGCSSSNSSRMGCTFCTIVTANKSAENFITKPRWKLLGMDKALRIRDYIWRLSITPSSRAFHARSIDPILQRVMLQQNVLKPKLTERVYRYLCQLTRDAEDVQYEIDAKGTLAFEGYQDILNDHSIHPKAKRDYLDMYAQGIRKPFYQFVTRNDAITLSFVWALDGLCTLNYAPIGIYNEVFEKNRSVAYPKLNSEMTVQPKLKSTPMHDAFALPLLSKEAEQAYRFEPLKEVLPYHDEWLHLIEERCPSSVIKPKHTLRLNVSYTAENDKTLIDSVSIVGSTKKYGIERFTAIEAELMEACQKHRLKRSSTDGLQQTVIELRHLKIKHIEGMPNPSARKKPNHYFKESTVRVRKQGMPTTTRLRFYNARPRSSLQQQHHTSAVLLNFDPTNKHDIDLNINDEQDYEHLAIESISIDSEVGTLYWNELDGWERAVREYEQDKEHYIHNLRKWKRKKAYDGLNIVRKMMAFQGITIAPRYITELRRIIYRSYILQQARAFDYQSLSLSQLERKAEQGALITMAQHRSDKAQKLLMLRSMRAADRQQLRHKLTGGDIAKTIIAKIDALKNTLTSINDTVANDFLTHFYREASSDFKAFQREMMTKHERHELEQNAQALHEAVKHFDCTFDVRNAAKTLNKVALSQQAKLFSQLI
ncbi:hypothetical protein [Vibrio agarivorans]|uniref:hypothetical protein n=1 Tax=Vibrio agarivorans TaxID=153622 RepID=UPI0025B36D53|nr:hypothetical protein [Vibrio agarivorans]MDN3661146.1 hypothetical protein [Vibrio agarivorans]